MANMSMVFQKIISSLVCCVLYLEESESSSVNICMEKSHELYYHLMLECGKSSIIRGKLTVLVLATFHLLSFLIHHSICPVSQGTSNLHQYPTFCILSVLKNCQA